ncbi:MAG: hypothetical protein LBK56_00055 [Gracilibacteraceae bacterium]|jgi:hypothetical protein|nr:hypothetical protein [Gracilibacteraceae bacterium]
MRKIARRAAIGAASLALAVFLAACAPGSLDVVGQDSGRAFGEVLQALPAAEAGDQWFVSAPDGGARFFWNGESAALRADIQPFAAAGADISLLANAESGDIVITREFSPAGREKSEPLADYELLAAAAGDVVGYHTALDHYNLDLGGGNLFEWAKDFAVHGGTGEIQDKDIVFVLDPQPFIDAGADPAKVEGWLYSPVTVDADGGSVEVYKFLKPADLR